MRPAPGAMERAFRRTESSTAPWIIYPVCATTSPAWAGAPILNPTLSLDRVNLDKVNLGRGSPDAAVNLAGNSRKAANSAAMGNPVRPASSRAKAVSLGKAVNRGKVVNPVKVGKVDKA